MPQPFTIFMGVISIAVVAVLALHPPGSSVSKSGAEHQTSASAAQPSSTISTSVARAASASEAPRATRIAASQPRLEATAAMQHAMPDAGPGDAAQGRVVFRKCSACHSIVAGKNLVGPSLAGIIDRKSGAVPSFGYSAAMKDAAVIWTQATLNTYLAEPKKFVPGNRMSFPGLKLQTERDDVIAFLVAGGQPTASPKAPPRNTNTARPLDVPDAKYTLRTGIAEGRMVYVGVGGVIEGKINPELIAAAGQGVQITLINGEGAEHDIVLPEENAKSPRVNGKGASTTIAFRAGIAGDFTYFCSTPGHRLAGMEGKFTVTDTPPEQVLAQADLSLDPADVPPPIGKRGPKTLRVDLETVEIEGRLAQDTTFGFWTFNGKVPGPMLRARVGDTIDIHLKNAADSSMIHSVDFHAATGPGGGAAALQVDPGSEKSMKFKLLVPGLYVYHCATPMVAEHIANGMYGMILVEPEGGLPKVDREFYVMQGEVYTEAAFGQHGSQEFSVEKLLGEHPEYFVFNGAVGAISTLHPLHAKRGEKVRIYFGVGGPNFTSSFHVIGEIFDNVYQAGGFITPPIHGLQTVSVPPGGATVVEFTPEVPGNYAIVDHALARMERGLVGIMSVEGQANLEVYDGTVMPGMGH